MRRIKWQSLVVVILITALLTSSCGLLNPVGGGGGNTIHRVSAEIEDSYDGPVLDYDETFPYEFERRERPQLGEDAAEFEGVEVEWNEAVRFISDELADEILLAEARTEDEEITIELDEAEAIYEPEEFLVHKEKRVGYYVESKEAGSDIIKYHLSIAHPQVLIEDFYIPEQEVYINTDNISFLGEGVTLVSGDDHQSSSSGLQPFSPSIAYAESEEEEENAESEEEEEEFFTLHVEHEWFEDDDDQELWVKGEIEVVSPRVCANWEFFTPDSEFHLRYIAYEAISLEVGGEFEFDMPLKYPIYGGEIPFEFGEVGINAYILIECDGSISFNYSLEQGVHLEAGIYGEKGILLPKRDTVRFGHKFESYLKVEGRVDGRVKLRAGAGVRAYLIILDYDIVNFRAAAGLEAKASYTQELDLDIAAHSVGETHEEEDEEEGFSYSQCFKLKFHAFLIIDGAFSYPKAGWDDDASVWRPGTWVPDFEIVQQDFELYSNSWLIYKFERCGEDVGEDSDFAVEQQPLTPGANLLTVRASDGLAVDISSDTRHGGTTSYYATNIPPETEVHLEAPEFVGEGASRSEFVHWHGVVNSPDRGITFTIDQEDAELSITAEYVDSPVYKLTVRGPSGLSVESLSGHEGVIDEDQIIRGLYVIEDILEDTQVHLSAPGTHDVRPFECNKEFLHWEGAEIRDTTKGEAKEFVEPTLLQRLSEIFVPESTIFVPESTVQITSMREVIDIELPELGPDRSVSFLMDNDKVLTPVYTRGERCAIGPDDLEPDPVSPPPPAPLNYTLGIRSSGVSSVPITGRFLDLRDGSTVSLFDGSTTFSKDNLRGHKLRLTAPEYVGSGESQYRFESWTGKSNVDPMYRIGDQPTGDFNFETTSRSVDVDIPREFPLSLADSEKIVTAHYVLDTEATETFNLTVNSTGDNRVGVDITSNTGHGGKTNYQVANIDPQAQVHLEAPEYLGSGAGRKSFSSWSGAISSSNRSINLVMDGEKAVTAHYVADPEVIEEPDDPEEPPEKYTLSVKSPADDPSMKIGVDITSKTGHGGRTPYTITGIEQGTEVHLQAPADIEQIESFFTGWSGAVSDTNRSITFTMDANISVTADYWFELF